MTIITNTSEIRVNEWVSNDGEATSYHLEFSSEVRKKLEYVEDLYRGFYSGNEIVATLRRLEADVHQLQEEKRMTEALIAANPAVKEAYTNYEIMAALAKEGTK